MKPSHVWMIAQAELKRIRNDKFLLLLLIFGVPILCTAFGFVAYKSPEEIHVAVFTDKSFEDGKTRQLIDEIDRSKSFSITGAYPFDSQEDVIQHLNQGDARAAIILNEGQAGIESIGVYLDARDPSIMQVIYSELPPVFGKYFSDISFEFLTSQGVSPQQAKQIVSPFETTFKTNARQDLKFFDFYASAAMVLIALGIPLLLTVTAITSERSTGTIERIFVSPYKRLEIIASKMIAHSVMMLMIAILTVATLKLVFDVALGNIGLVLLIIMLIGVNGVIFGLLISSITYTEAESVLMGVICFLGFMVLMTYLWPWETMHPAVEYMSYLIPFTYGIQAMRHVNMIGAGFSDVWLNLVILAGFIVIQALIASQVLRRRIA